jgi:hypothetical protein
MRRSRVVLVPFVLAAAFVVAPSANAAVVAPYTAHPRGHSYDSWLRMVGQFYLGDSSNPLIAGLDGDCGELRDGVFWMAAPIQLGAEFDCDVPVGTWVVLSPAGWFSTEGIDGTTDEELVAAAQAGFVTPVDRLTLDGRDVALKTLDTGAFDVISEPGSFYDAILGVGTGSVRTALRGNVVVIPPLRPGDHTIESAVTFANGDAFSATYHIHVG